MASAAVSGDGDSSDQKRETVLNVGGGGDGEVSALESDPEFLKYLRVLHGKWSDCPPLTINYYHLSYNINIPKASHDIVSVPQALFNIAMSVPRKIQSLFQSAATKREKVHRFAALHKAAGCIAPGSMTLVLAPPGHGKTTLLKAISGRLHGDKNFTGSLMYNGMSAAECRDRGINVTRLCAYVGQQDFTFPTLTVKETLEFAAKNAVPDIQLLADNPNSEEDKNVVDYDEKRAELLINLLGMKECKDTIVGNDLLRGISGGQKKRVALAEMLLTNARVYCLDEVSTGLDAAVTKYIFQQFKEAVKITKASIVAALLQPTPETYELFDDVILLREGVVVYHGPKNEVQQWLRECIGMPKPHGVDEAQWILDVLTDPISAHHTMIEMQKAAAMSGSTSMQSRQLTLLASPPLRPKRQEEEEKRSADLLERAHSFIQSPPLQAVNAFNPSHSHSQSDETEKEGFQPTQVVFHMNGHEHTVAHDAEEKEHNINSVEHMKNLKGISPGAEIELQRINQPALFMPIPNKIRTVSDSLLTQSGHGSGHSGHEDGSSLLNEKVGNKNECTEFMHAYLKSIGSGEFATPAVDTDTMHYNYKHSQWYVRQLLKGARQMNDSDELDSTHWSKYTTVMFGSKYPHSMWEHTKMCLARQSKIISRNRTMVRPRIFQAILMGFIFGTLFYQLSADDYSDKMGLLLYCVMFCAFANLTELPVAGEAKNVVGKQLDAGFFPPLSYTISVVIMHFPVCIIEILIFGTMIYFIPGFTEDAGRYFFFLLILLGASTAMSVFFRSISYIARNPDVARQMDIPFIVIFLIFGGFLLPYNSVPNWLIWLYWISPFSWAVRSLALNEFKADRFNGFNSKGERLGDVYLNAFDIFTEDIWKWMGLVYLVGFFFLATCFSVFVLSGVKPVTPLGTRRQATHHKRLKQPKNDHITFTVDGHIVVHAEGEEHVDKKRDSPIPESSEEKEEAEKVSDETAAVEAGIMSPATSTDRQMKIENANKKNKKNNTDSEAGKKSNQSAMPFTPVTIAWKDLNYTVYVGKHLQPKQLLHSVNGFASPGEMTALMGASGAGKTTLMDVIAARKTTGKIEGDILVNGVKVSNEDFQHLMGYVEQNDIHLGTTTVKEAVEFSAQLRLPASVSAEQRRAFVSEVIELVGLSSIADRLVGDAALPGISPGQLKLVTIAVELVANPSILFLDEPTSGLDAPAALRVMKAIRNIAGTGRTVVCTIHQPSAQLFYMFDRLLLLRSGGRTVYFSKIGKKGRKLVDYFQALDKRVPPCPRHINPANWMLDVIGAAGNAIVDFDFADRWDKSPLAVEAIKELDVAFAKSDSVDGLKVGQLAYASWVQRFYAVLHRSYVSHWRNPPMNATRIILMIVVGLLLGIIYEDISTSSFSGVQSKLSVLFLGVAFPASVCAGSASPTLFRQRAVYYRETTSKMYDFHHYAHSLMLVELPWIAIALICFLLPYYFMIGFANDAGLFFRFSLVVYLMSICYSFLSQLWLALMPNSIVANVINGLFMSLFFMFGGLFIKADSIPKPWKWFYYIDPVPKALIASSTTQFYCGDPTGCQMITVPGNSVATTVSDYIATTVNGNHTEYWMWIGWLLLEVVVLRIFTLFCLRYISHIKR